MSDIDDSTIQPQDADGDGETTDEKTLAVRPGAALEEPARRIAHYRIEREIGRGGQGAVYLAEDERLHRLVALKLLPEQAGSSSAARLRFKREAEIASRLDHEVICTVYDAGESDGTLYIAMRYVDGSPLDALVRERRRRVEETGETSSAIEIGEVSSTTGRGRGELEPVLRMFEKILRALQIAHEAGLVHRDIKPGNIMVTKNGEPVILDFGLARMDDAEGPTLTRTGDLMGTPAYMSPEQISSKAHALDARSDVYSTAVSLYECLTLHRPHRAPTREKLYQEILHRDPPDPRTFNSRIDSDLKVVLDRALEKNPDHRYSSAGAFADDLLAVIEGRPIAARPITPLGRSWRWCRRRPALASLLAVSLLGLATLAGLGLFMVARQPLVEQARAERERKQIDHELELAYLAVDARRNDDAMMHFRRATNDQGPVPEALAGMLSLLATDERFADAVALAEEHQDEIDRRPGLVAVVSYCKRRVAGETDGEALDGVVFEEPDDAIDCFILSLREEAMAERDVTNAWNRAAAYMLQAVLLSDRPRALYHFRLAYVAGCARELDLLRETTKAVTTRWPGEAASWYWSGSAWLEAGRPEEARPLLERSLELANDFARAEVALARALQALGETKKARTHLEHAAASDPQDADALRRLGGLARTEGAFTEALRHYEAAVERAPGDDDCWFELAETQVALNDIEAALASYRMAIDCDPDYGPYHGRLAEALVILGRPDEAITAIGRGIDASLELALQRVPAFNEAGYAALPATILIAAHERVSELENDPDLGQRKLLGLLVKAGFGESPDSEQLSAESRRGFRDRARALATIVVVDWALRAKGNLWTRTGLRQEVAEFTDTPLFLEFSPARLARRISTEEAALWAPLIEDIRKLRKSLD